MSDPTARALRVLELLHSAHERSAGELAQHLGVDERTVRRDVARLVGAGVPVESRRGRYGGYRLAAGRRVLPVTFSSEEAVAVFLRLAPGRAAGDPKVAEQTALAKITRAMRLEDAQRVDAVLGATESSARQRTTVPDPAVMLTLADAARRRRVVDLRYRDGGGTPSRRTVHPDALVSHADRWYLVAFDPAAREDRTFRVDRISTARALQETFDARTPHPDRAAWLVEHFAAADYRWTVLLRVRATEDRIRAHLPPSVARLERVGEARGAVAESGPPWYRAEIHAERLDWLPAVIASLGCEVVVDRPDELRHRVRAAATRLLRAAGDGTPSRVHGVRDA